MKPEDLLKGAALEVQQLYKIRALEKRIAELEQFAKGLDGNRIAAEAEIDRLEKLNAAMEAILERVPHKSARGAWGCKTPCASDCPRCAYEKLKEGNRQQES